MWHRKRVRGKKRVVSKKKLFVCWPHQVLLSPFSAFFFFAFFIFFFNIYILTKEADGPNFKPKLLVRVPKVSQHDVHDWHLINFGSVNLHHSLSVSLPDL